jgi:hypothetical protein
MFGFGDANIDPEAGIAAEPYSGIGRVEGPTEGTGEGMRRMKFSKYAEIGTALIGQHIGGDQSVVPQQLSNLTSGFNQNWLSEALAAGSANGAHL